jgi:hypothetical protein
LAAGQPGEFDTELLARGPEIENAVLRKCRRQRIGITVVETEGITMQCVGNLIPVAILLC